MIKRFVKQVGDKYYEVEDFDEGVICHSPYSAVIFVPPTRPHRANFFKIAYIEEGAAEISFFSKKGGAVKKVQARAKDAFIISPNDIHQYSVNPKMKYCHKDIYVSVELMKTCCDIIQKGLYEEIVNREYSPFFRLSTSTLSSISEMLTPIVFEHVSEVNDAIHKSIVLYMLGQYITTNEYYNNYPKWIKKLLLNLNTEAFLLMNVEEMVETTGFSHSYVCAQFKRYMGIPLKTYVNKCKLSIATVMLSSTNCSLEDIVDRLDFNTVSNFINLFKVEYGMTPGKYRKGGL